MTTLGDPGADRTPAGGVWVIRWLGGQEGDVSHIEGGAGGVPVGREVHRSAWLVSLPQALGQHEEEGTRLARGKGCSWMGMGGQTGGGDTRRRERVRGGQGAEPSFPCPSHDLPKVPVESLGGGGDLEGQYGGSQGTPQSPKCHMCFDLPGACGDSGPGGQERG